MASNVNLKFISYQPTSPMANHLTQLTPDTDSVALTEQLLKRIPKHFKEIISYDEAYDIMIHQLVTLKALNIQELEEYDKQHQED